jgi:hypothetical protein
MREHSFALLAAAIGLAATQASAADLPRKAPAYVPPAPPFYRPISAVWFCVALVVASV